MFELTDTNNRQIAATYKPAETGSVLSWASNSDTGSHLEGARIPVF